MKHDIDSREYENEKKALLDQLDQLKKQFLALKEESSDVFAKDAKDIKSQLQDFYSVVKGKADKSLGELKDDLADYTSEVQNRLGQFTESAQNGIQKNPLESLLGAGLVGLLLGFIIGKKN